MPGDSVVLTYMLCSHCRPCHLGEVYYCENVYPWCFGGARLDKSTATRRQGQRMANEARADDPRDRSPVGATSRLVALSLHTDFENFTAFRPASFH